MNSKKFFLTAWAAYALFLLFWMIRFWGNIPALMDTLEYVFPEKWFNVESFQHGSIPLWNPYIGCGTPHLAAFQPAPFYPFFWLWNLTGLTHWFFVVALLHSFLAAVGFYLWLRALKVSQGPSLLCALSWGASAQMTLMWGFPTHLAALTWVPWIFAATTKFIEENSWKRWLFICVFWALEILAGYPIFTFYAAILWFLFVFWRSGNEFKRSLVALTAFGAAIGLTALQWLPFLDFLGYMHREIWGGNVYNLKWVEYLTLLWPNFLGTPGTSGYLGDYGNFIFGNFYLGLVPLFFLLWALVRTKGIFWKLNLVFWFLLPAGIHLFPFENGSNEFLDKLEVSKCAFLFIFSAFTLIPFALDGLFKKGKKSSVRKYEKLILCLWILDLMFISFRVVHVVPDPYQDASVKEAATKVAQAVGEGRIMGLRGQEEVYSSAVTDYASSFEETAKRLSQNTNVVWSIRSAQAHLTSLVDGYQNLSTYIQKGYPYDGRVLDAAGVKVILTSEPLPAFKYKLRESLGGWDLVRNAGAMPGEWGTEQQKIFSGRAESFGMLLDPKAFVENVCGFETGRDGSLVCLNTLPGQPSVEENSPCSCRFDIPAGPARVFVLGQCFAPGWHAWVDGRPSPIYRADGLWMAVTLGSGGSHQVDFQYAPQSFQLGIFLSFLTAAFLVFVSLVRFF